MKSQSVTCTGCGKNYQIQEGVPQSFCVYCGQQQAVHLVLPDDGVERKAELEKLISQAQPDVRVIQALAMWNARFTPVGRKQQRLADEFIRLWSVFFVYGRGGLSAHKQAQIQKEVEAFFKRKALQDALDGLDNPQQALYEELLDSACFYVRLCLTDRHYTSGLFELIRLKPRDVARKLAEDIGNTILASLLEMPDTPQVQQMLSAMVCAYRRQCSEYAELLDARIAVLQLSKQARLQAAISAWHTEATC